MGKKIQFVYKYLFNMKTLLFLLLLSFTITAKAQTYVREGNTIYLSTGERNNNNTNIKTNVKVNKKGKEYEVYCSQKTGACYILVKSSKTGKEYKSYLPANLSKEIAKENNIEYKSKRKN